MMNVDRLVDRWCEAGVEDEFELYGPSYGEEKFSLLSGADAFVHTSRWEGLPFAVVEAMAMKQLCVVTPAADPAGLNCEREAGIASGETASEIADSLVRTMKLSADERHRLIENAQGVVETEMRWEIIGDKVSKSYVEILANRP